MSTITVYPGTTVDLTLGDGLDAIHLSGLVGTKGKVFAFDIQDEAENLAYYSLKKKTTTFICLKNAIRISYNVLRMKEK